MQQTKRISITIYTLYDNITKSKRKKVHDQHKNETPHVGCHFTSLFNVDLTLETILTCHAMDGQTHTIGKAIRPLFAGLVTNMHSSRTAIYILLQLCTWWQQQQQQLEKQASASAAMAASRQPQVVFIFQTLMQVTFTY